MAGTLLAADRPDELGVSPAEAWPRVERDGITVAITSSP